MAERREGLHNYISAIFRSWIETISCQIKLWSKKKKEKIIYKLANKRTKQTEMKHTLRVSTVLHVHSAGSKAGTHVQ